MLRKHFLVAALLMVSWSATAQRVIEVRQTLGLLLATDPRNKNTVWFVPGDPGAKDGTEGIYVYDPLASDPVGGNVFAPNGPYPGRWFKYDLPQYPIDPSKISSGIDPAKISAGIDPTKISPGTVSSTEFGNLDGLTGPIMPLFDTKLSISGGTITGDLTVIGRFTGTNVYIVVDEFYLETMTANSADIPFISTDQLTLNGVPRSTWPDSGGSALSGTMLSSGAPGHTNWVATPMDLTGTNIVWRSLASILGFTPEPEFSLAAGPNITLLTNGTTVTVESTASGGTSQVLTGGSASVVDLQVRRQTNSVTGNMTFAHATNGVAGEGWQHDRWLLNRTTNDYSLTIPDNWGTNTLSAVPGLTNMTATLMQVHSIGDTDSVVKQANVFVDFKVFNIANTADFASLTTGLSNYWAMDESSDGSVEVLRGDSVGDFDLEDDALAASGTGKIGNAVYLNETGVAEGEGLTKGWPTTLQVGDFDFSFSVWFKFSSVAANSTIFSEYCFDSGFDNDAFGLFYFTDTPRLQWTVKNATSSSVQIDGALSTGVWYHVVCWHDSVNDQIGISLNGVDATPVAHSVGAHSTTNYDFGVGRCYGSAAQFLEGAVDELGFWKKVLSPAERIALYNGGSGYNPLN